MKFFAILFVASAVFQTRRFLASARAVDAVEKFDEAELACTNELHFSRNGTETIKGITPENDDELNDFLACCWQRAGLQNSKNGNIDYDVLKEGLLEAFEQLSGESKILVKQIIMGAIDECKNSNIRGKNHGQTAVKAQNCVIRKLNELTED